jgi:hypothetical protein
MISLTELLAAPEAFVTKFPDGSSLCWRLLTLREYETFRGLVSSGIAEERYIRCEVVDLCVFDTAIIDELYAGYVDGLGALILWLSGDCNNQTLKADLTAAKQLFTGKSVFEHMSAVVLTAFPNLTFIDIDSWSRNKLIQTFIRAEHILAYRLGPEVFTYLDVDAISFGEEEYVDDIKYVDITTGEPDQLDIWSIGEDISKEQEQKVRKLQSKFKQEH